MTRLHVENFRSIVRCDVVLRPYTVFIGKNNSGKSNILKAIEAFFTGSVTRDDFHKSRGEDGRLYISSSEIVVAIEFQDLRDFEVAMHEDILLDSSSRYSSGDERVENRHDSVFFNKPTIWLRARFTLSGNSGKVGVVYEAWKMEVSDADIPARFRWLFPGVNFTSIKSLEEAGGVPDEFKKIIINRLKRKKQESGSSRLNKAINQYARDEYLRRHPEILANIPKVKRWVEYRKLKVSSMGDMIGSFFFIPAVQDFEREVEFRATWSTIIKRLMDLIFKRMKGGGLDSANDSGLAGSGSTGMDSIQPEDIIEEQVKKIYQIDDAGSPIKALQDKLNADLAEFDNALLRFDIQLPSIDKLVRDSLRIYLDDGIETQVQYKGHGLQRYLIFALLKALAGLAPGGRGVIDGSGVAFSDGVVSGAMDDTLSSGGGYHSIFFAIEEPELFLHPQSQRIMMGYLNKIASQPSSQVLINTHSPNFIEFDKVENLVRVIKDGLDVGTQIIQLITHPDIGTDLRMMVQVSDRERRKSDRVNYLNMSYYLNPDRNEMFFADKVVLVEGQTEKLMFRAFADYFFKDDFKLLNSVTYIDCLGKNNMKLYIRILKEFRIPFVLIMDTDVRKDGSSKRKNEHIKAEIEKISFACCFELDDDFEDEFGIVDTSSSNHHSSRPKRRDKPYHAFTKYFDVFTGSPRVQELEALRDHDKLVEIFKEVYGKSIRTMEVGGFTDDDLDF
ncbi:MAG: AAA family ATPase [Promethearchaeota archaeon]